MSLVVLRGSMCVWLSPVDRAFKVVSSSSIA